MPFSYRATTDSDQRIDRDPPDVTDVVLKAFNRCNRLRASQRDHDDCEQIIETELDALAAILRSMLQRPRVERKGLGGS